VLGLVDLIRAGHASLDALQHHLVRAAAVVNQRALW
jgi:hypothetical protein